MPTPEPVDLNAVFSAVSNAFVSVICNIGFQVAIHGLMVALVICLLALISMKRGTKTGPPLMAVFRKLSLFCLALALPGALCLVTSGKLPAVNSLQLNSFGLIGFWSLVVAHLCMEEMNYQWFGAE